MALLAEIKLLHRQALALSRQLLILTRTIKSLAQKGNVVQVIDRLKKRQEIIAEPESIEKKLVAQRRNQRFRWSGIAAPGREGIRKLVTVIKRVLEDVVSLDLKIRALLQYERGRVSAKLKKVSIGHKLLKRYLPPEAATPRYFRLSA